MIPQTSSSAPEIRRYGCYFYVMLFFAEQIEKKLLTDEQILTIYEKAQKIKNWSGKRPVMDANCRLNDPEAVTNLAIAELGGTDYIRQIGVERGGVVTRWSWVLPAETADYIAEEWATDYGSHFVCGDFDPDPGVERKKLIKKILYRRY